MRIADFTDAQLPEHAPVRIQGFLYTLVCADEMQPTESDLHDAAFTVYAHMQRYYGQRVQALVPHSLRSMRPQFCTLNLLGLLCSVTELSPQCKAMSAIATCKKNNFQGTLCSLWTLLQVVIFPVPGQASCFQTLLRAEFL